MSKELVDRSESVRLNSIIGSVDNELRDLRLSGSKSQELAQQQIDARCVDNFFLHPGDEDEDVGRAGKRYVRD
jgi:hypothetical protein